ncbi:MAG: TetR/AcrR family transcriptional regulator [Phenylobacterium sp.]|uniref:TetR/AcrR family transcriptional regulator n=1 Tax=Phenylobacterium sp. TaxID=1871053 RepID=UPI0027373A17|nr:TetR/AcrR family transcriptional regulator [Phenylobacterium sp.]MDP1642032.1 TetR/AcrR family transcriptional regulator [Phenylobacterium sp.]MDP3116504.1 TetR/AcrR family transcriptional regulator [Phenylobacterium sp.]MDP3385308.1 TetR/AcrR family transcriptional regulator [Phenylobacterium sp.]
MTVATSPPPRARYAARRDAILAAACKVFIDQGVSGFTLAAVAKRMDLHPVSLTYYFKRKEDLAAECMRLTLSRFNAMLESAEREETAQARLRAFVGAYFETRRGIVLGEAPRLLPFGEITQIGAPGDEELVEAYRALRQRLARLLRPADAPWLTGPRRYMLAHLIIDQLCWSDTWIAGYEIADFGRVAEKISDVMINGLAAPGQTRPDKPLLDLGAPPALNDEVTRERFLVAATEIINREGYRGASVDKISAYLNVTKGSFYHHNTDKDELARACFERTFDLIDEAKSRGRSEPSGWERLWLISASLTAHQTSGERGRMLRHFALSAMPGELRRSISGRFQQIANAFSGIIADGIADGSLRPVDPLLSAHLVMAMFNSVLLLEHWGEDATVETVISAYVRPALMGFFTPE